MAETSRLSVRGSMHNRAWHLTTDFLIPLLLLIAVRTRSPYLTIPRPIIEGSRGIVSVLRSPYTAWQGNALGWKRSMNGASGDALPHALGLAPTVS
jgi:hypothetical protein